MNAREHLKAIEDWLSWQDESLSAGLRNAFDALRLYDYAQDHPALPEMADEWTTRSIVAAVGYNPFEREPVEVSCTGAASAFKALCVARSLIDSVAFVAAPGDTVRPLRLADAVVGAPAR